jgi:glycosyltransferase involved in cell wall biosynthesis
MATEVKAPHFRLESPRHSRRPKLLMSAYACSPDRGSEPGVGWNRALLAAKDFDTWVLTEDSVYGTAIRQYLAAHGPIDGLTFVYVPKSRLVRLLRRIGLYYASMRFWHYDAYRIGQRRHEEIGFDAVHQVNFMTFREPGYLWKIDAPFVWGPWGGVQNYPWRFLPMAGPVAAMREAVRSVVNVLQLRFNRRVKQAARRAVLLVACNSENQSAFNEVHGIKPKVLAGNGVAELLSDSPKASANGPLKILWVGRLEGFKGLPLLLKALASLGGSIEWELQVIGQGPKLRSWQALARRLGVADRVCWSCLGIRDVYNEYRKSDLFAFTSMRESVPTVLIEALSAGLPIVYLDHHGMSDMVPLEAGIGIPVGTPKQVVSDLARSIQLLADDPQVRERMSAASIDQAHHYLWSNQGKQLNLLMLRALKFDDAEVPKPKYVSSSVADSQFAS